MTASEHIARLHALADEGEAEAMAAARAADEATAALLGWTVAELKAHYRKVNAGPPARREDVARVMALFGLVIAPEPAAERQAS